MYVQFRNYSKLNLLRRSNFVYLGANPDDIISRDEENFNMHKTHSKEDSKGFDKPPQAYDKLVQVPSDVQVIIWVSFPSTLHAYLTFSPTR